MSRPPYPPNSSAIVYSSLVKQVIEDYGITHGVCLNVGSGRGFVGIALAERTHLEIVLVDIDRRVLWEALRNSEQTGVKDKITGLQADVHILPFRNESVDLVVSRGSLFFWEDKIMCLREIHRILNPSGVAFFGGGLGRYLPEEERKKLMENIRLDPAARRLRSPIQYREWLTKAQIRKYRIIPDPPGAWMEIRKKENADFSDFSSLL